MHEVHTRALGARRGRWPVVWGALLGEQAMWLVCLSRQASARSVRVQAFEQANAGPNPGHPHSEAPWWLAHMRRTAQASAWPWPRLRWPTNARGPLALAWPQAQCRQGVLVWPGEPDTPALRAEVHLEAASALGLPPAEVGFDFQPQISASNACTVAWAAAARAPLRAGQQHLRAAGWQVPHIEPEALAAQRAAECLLGEPVLPWAVPVRDWQFATRPQRHLPDAAWRALQDSPHWGALAACGAALAVLA